MTNVSPSAGFTNCLMNISCVIVVVVVVNETHNFRSDVFRSGLTVYVRLSTETSTSKGPEAAQLPWTEGQSQTVVANLGFR